MKKSVGVCTRYPFHTQRLWYRPSKSERATPEPTLVCMQDIEACQKLDTPKLGKYIPMDIYCVAMFFDFE